ncbi:hypothetical protein [Amycolatopsis sp. NPDC098790]|uniref:hypothetical protein n=1 Tax=Amycolatopsis sp. NPDC098790 TaxID=3363939 RepID=UPI0037F41C73
MPWDVVDAVGSILGGVFGGLAFFATLVLLVHEIRTRRAAEEDEQARQARLVVSATTRQTYPPEAGHRVVNVEGMVWNYSDMPVFELAVTLEPVGTGRQTQRILQPGESVPVRLAVDMFGGREIMNAPEIRAVELSLRFLDAHGRQWHRIGNDQPRRVLENRRTPDAQRP